LARDQPQCLRFKSGILDHLIELKSGQQLNDQWLAGFILDDGYDAFDVSVENRPHTASATRIEI